VGRPGKLSTAQLAKVEKALAKGAEANGYVTDVWTLPRVAEVIERLTGVAYHPGYVWYILRGVVAWRRVMVAAFTPRLDTWLRCCDDLVRGWQS
jgi:Winged helix-turn helix